MGIVDAVFSTILLTPSSCCWHPANNMPLSLRRNPRTAKHRQQHAVVDLPDDDGQLVITQPVFALAGAAATTHMEARNCAVALGVH